MVTANVHSGWRGALQHIKTKALDTAPLHPAHSIAFLGPTIRVCCFEVGEEVAVEFPERFVDRALGPKPHVDIPAFTAAILRERGLEQIVDTELCTRCGTGVSKLRGLAVSGAPTAGPRNPDTSQPLFHSYRRDKKSGRNLAIVTA